MPRSMVGLLAAVGTAMSSLVAFAHGHLIWVTIANAAAATGLAAYAAAPSKKILTPSQLLQSYCLRFAARVSGLASGLALAVRPAGSVEAPALKGGSRRSFLRSG